MIDSAGVRHVRNDATAPPRWNAELLVKIGGSVDDVDIVATKGGALLSTGAIVLADTTRCRIQILDGFGNRASELGGCGYGPEEFRRIRSLRRMRGDTMIVTDPGRQRSVWLHRD